jgi:signal transduction histidine kinase/ligand-binding sensor domain-containing protein
MNRARLLLAVVLGLGGAVEARALDPGRATSQYVVTKWGAGTLPSATIHALLQTRDRYLWLGTTTGLVRFDGATFTVFNARHAPSFGDGGVSQLAEGVDGSLYVGKTAGTVLQYQGGLFTRPGVPSGTGEVSALLAARDGSVWVGIYGRRMVRLVKGQPAAFPDDVIFQAPFAMAEDGQGGVWLGTREAGLVRWQDGRFEKVDVTSDAIEALCFDRAGALWIGTPHGLLRLKDGKVDRYTREHGLTHQNVTAIVEDRDGNLWVGTAGGLNRLSGGKWSRLTTIEGLSDDDVRCLMEDRDGNLWVGTADGLNGISDGPFVTYGRLEGLDDPAILSAAPGSGGSVWVGTWGGGVARLRDGRMQHFRLPVGVGREAVLALHESRDGSLWMALDNARLFRLQDGRITERTPIDAPRDWKVRAMFEADDGIVFLVAAGGLARLEGRRLVALHPDAPKLRYPHMAHRDAHGALWVCDLRGLTRLQAGQWKTFTFGDQTDEMEATRRVRWVSVEPDGGAWAATSAGLGYVKDERVRLITVAQGLPENYLRLVLDDGLGHLWIASHGYVFRLAKEEALALFEGRLKHVSPLVFDASDGLKTTEGLRGSSPGFRAADGRLWFATGKGLSVVDPARIPKGDVAPPVSIEQVTVDGVKETRAAYDPGRGEVTIDYTTLSFRAPSKLRFRHRLEGLDDDWVEAGAARRAYYSSLRPGRYRFSVMACNWEGAWNGEPATMELTILPPFYQTPFFFLMCGAVVAAAVAAAHRIRVNQMRGRFAAILQERTRIARELHDTLAQGLAGVKFQIDTALATMADEPEIARESIQFAGSMVTSSLAEVRRSIWVLRAQAGKGKDGLGSTVTESLKQLTAESAIDMRTRVSGVPRPLLPEVERNMLRIAHEAVTNALRHASAKSLVVELEFEGEGVCLRVRDDGRGFDPDTYLHGARGEHFGLLGISERAQSIGGELRVRSRPGEGTEIECRLPYDCRTDPGESEMGEGASL